MSTLPSSAKKRPLSSSATSLLAYPVSGEVSCLIWFLFPCQIYPPLFLREPEAVRWTVCRGPSAPRYLPLRLVIPCFCRLQRGHALPQSTDDLPLRPVGHASSFRCTVALIPNVPERDDQRIGSNGDMRRPRQGAQDHRTAMPHAPGTYQTCRLFTSGVPHLTNRAVAIYISTTVPPSLIDWRPGLASFFMPIQRFTSRGFALLIFPPSWA